MQPPFHVETRVGEHATVLAVTGELDLTTAGELESQLELVWESSAQLVIVDLRGVEFMDSTGVRTVVLANRRAKHGRRRFAVVDGFDQVHAVLSRTGVLAALLVMAPEDLPA